MSESLDYTIQDLIDKRNKLMTEKECRLRQIGILNAEINFLGEEITKKLKEQTK